jgi:ATP-dependent DNA ligase
MSLFESLEVSGPTRTTSETFDDGAALFTAVCNLGLEGVVAKDLASRYRPTERRWIKLKKPNCWRRDTEREAPARSREHRAQTRV